MLSIEERAENDSTYQHIDQVMRLLGHAQVELMRRQYGHDRSKLLPPEVSMFAEYGDRLKELTYGSDEYKDNLKSMGPALKHHYISNRHHPEHYPNGIEGMNLFDVLEMLIDWYAATKRHPDGNIYSSLSISEERFHIEPQLMQVIRNTVPWITGSIFEPCTKSQATMQPMTALDCNPRTE
jgi:Family of unknown function (DUF5662)